MPQTMPIPGQSDPGESAGIPDFLKKKGRLDLVKEKFGSPIPLSSAEPIQADSSSFVDPGNAPISDPRPSMIMRQGQRLPYTRRSGGEEVDQGTPIYPRQEGEIAEGPTGDTVGQPSMMPQDLLKQYVGNATEMQRRGGQMLDQGSRAVQGSLDTADQMKSLNSGMAQVSTDIASLKDPHTLDSQGNSLYHQYDPSFLRKALGIAYGVMGGGIQGYEDVAGMPRQRAIASKQQQMQGFMDQQKALETRANAYKGAGSDIAAVGDAYARLGQTSSGMLQAAMPQFGEVNYAGPNNQPMTGLQQKNYGISGYPGYMPPQGQVQAPQKFTYKDTIDQNGPQVTGFSESGGPPLKTGQTPQATNEETMLSQSPEGRKILQNPALYAKFKRDQSYRQEVLAAEMLRHNDQMLAQSYRFNDEQLDKVGTDLNNKFPMIERVRDLLRKGVSDPALGGKPNQQADTEAAIQILGLTAGGGNAAGGVGIRPNREILDKIGGGGNKWTTLEGELRQWGAPGSTQSIPPRQRQQLLSLVDEVEKLAREKSNVLDDARSRLAAGKNPNELENIKVDALRKLHGDGGAGAAHPHTGVDKRNNRKIYSDDNTNWKYADDNTPVK